MIRQQACTASRSTAANRNPAPDPRPSRWLQAAGWYNIVFGLWVVARPGDLFNWIGVQAPIYPAIWQCLGMVIGVYGIGYLVAAHNPSRHWPIVLVGLLGKVFGPIGFLVAWSAGDLPASFGFLLITNDLIWWAPFSALLWRAAADHHAAGLSGEPVAGESLTALLESVTTRSGRTLAGISYEGPTLLVMSRHLGCVFCRQLLSDLSDAMSDLRERGVKPVIVYPSRHSSHAEAIFAMYGLDGSTCEQLADPQRRIYQGLSMQRGDFARLFGLRSILAALRSWWVDGHKPGRPQGDAFQLAGVALIADGTLIDAHACQTSSERVNLLAFVDKATPSAAATNATAPLHAA